MLKHLGFGKGWQQKGNVCGWEFLNAAGSYPLTLNVGSFVGTRLDVGFSLQTRWESLQGELVPVRATLRLSTSVYSQLEAQLLRLQGWNSFLWDSISTPGMTPKIFLMEKQKTKPNQPTNQPTKNKTKNPPKNPKPNQKTKLTSLP